MLCAAALHAVACLLLDAGLRIDEALSLEPSGLDFDNLLVTVRGKGQKERRIPFSHEMRKILYRWDQACAKAVRHLRPPLTPRREMPTESE